MTRRKVKVGVCRQMVGLLALPAVFGVLALAGVSTAGATTPTVSPYGQVSAVGGYDSNATYAPYVSGSSANLTTSNLTTGKFVYPLGMAVIPDPNISGGQDVYVLDNTNPQENNVTYNGVSNAPSPTALMQYRIQEFQVAANGTINPAPVAATSFELPSSTSHPMEHAASLAVDANSGRVYVLIDDFDPNLASQDGGTEYDTAEEIDAWSLGLGAANSGTHALSTLVPGTELTPSSGSATPSELVGPDTTTKLTTANGVGDIDGQSIATAGTGSSTELALGGDVYSINSSNQEVVSAPQIEEFTDAGALDTSKGNAGLWDDAAATQNATAQSADGQSSSLLGQLSSNPDGSLNAVFLDANNTLSQDLDSEPNTATIPADLDSSGTTPVLPHAGAAALTDANSDAGFGYWDEADTDGLGQDTATSGVKLASGAAFDAGTLAPSVVELSGGGGVPSGLYAGIVANSTYQYTSAPFSGGENWDANDPNGIDDAWQVEPYGNSFVDNGDSTAPSSIGIRIFDATGDPVSFIGDQTSGAACNLDGGPSYGLTDGPDDGTQSFAALAAGSDGSVFALIQPGLTPGPTSSDPVVDTASSVDEGAGDELVEFASDAGTACPQATGGVTVSDATSPSTSIPSSGDITVTAGTRLTFDASQINLEGGAPWSYDWDLGDNTSTNQDDSAGVTDQDPYWDDNNFAWYWPNMGSQSAATESYTYATPGVYTSSLALTSDWGTNTYSRTVNVTGTTGTLSPSFTVSSNPTAGSSVTFNASGTTTPQFDSITDYHWSFGDGSSDDTNSPVDTHTYSGSGAETVTLTVTDALHQTATTSKQVTVASAPTTTQSTTTPTPTTTTTQAPPSTTTTQPVITTTTTDVQENRSAPNVSPKLSAGADLVTVEVSCPATKVACGGAVKLEIIEKVKVGKKVKTKVVVLGSGSFSGVSGGKSKSFSVKLNAAGRALLAKDKSLKLTVAVSAHDTYGDSSSKTMSVTLKAPSKKTKKPKRVLTAESRLSRFRNA